MPGPYDPSLSRVRVSTTSGGVYSVVGTVRNFRHTAGTEGGGRLRYFGGETLRPGENTESGSFDVFWDRDDTNGQQVLRASRDNGTTVWLQLAPQGTAAGAKVDQFEARITSYDASGDAAGEAVEGSFSYEGISGTKTVVTLV